MIRINFDIRAYLAERLPGRFHEDSRGWLIGACLFHRDGRRPNLGVHPETGGFRCLSCGAHGNVVKLVQRIENLPTYEEAREWLIYHYGLSDDLERDAPIDLQLGPEVAPKKVEFAPPDEQILAQFRYRHPYLGYRGISETWQRRFEVGFDRRTQSITLPWRDRKGRLITVKHRSVASKAFWYWPRVPYGVKNTLLFGLHHIARRRDITAWITEAEIDAISLWQSGRPAVALGGAYMSREQARELALAGVGRVVLACDRDEAGKRVHELIRERLRPYGTECVDTLWPDCGAKDANELLMMGRLDELNIAGNGLSLGGLGSAA